MRYQGPPKHRPPGNPTKAAPCFEALHVSRDLVNIFYIFLHIFIFIEKSLEVKLPTIRTVGKAEVGRVREEEKKRED